MSDDPEVTLGNVVRLALLAAERKAEIAQLQQRIARLEAERAAPLVANWDGPTHEQIDRSRIADGLPPIYADEWMTT